MGFMEILEPLAEDVWLIFRFDRLFIQLLLRLTARDQAVLGNIVTETVSGLGVLPCRLQVGVSNGIAELLQIGIRSRLKLLV